jgi:hypothetical protein
MNSPVKANAIKNQEGVLKVRFSVIAKESRPEISGSGRLKQSVDYFIDKIASPPKADRYDALHDF